MTTHLNKITALVTLFALTACGGSGAGGSPAARPAPGTNGLNYGFPGQSIAEAEGVEVTQQAANIDGTNATVAEGTITLDAGFTTNDTNAGNGTVQIFGETVIITNGEGTLANGQIVNINFEPDRSGTYAGALEVISYGSLQSVLNPQDGESHTVFGFETNPATINRFGAETGTVRYAGGFQASGLVRNAGGTVIGQQDGTELEGAIVVNVDFATDRAAGTLDGSYNASGGDVDVDLEFANAALNSNGFESALTCTSACTGSATVDATFYGPNADELGGVLALNITQDNNGDQYDGVGTFIITP